MTQIEKKISDPSVIIVRDLFLIAEENGREIWGFWTEKRPEIPKKKEREDPLGR